MAVDYNFFSKISKSQFNQFLHECVDDLIDKRKSSFDDYTSADIQWTEKDYDKAKKYIRTIYQRGVIENNFEVDANLTENVKEAINNCYEVRRKEMFQALAKENILKNGHNLVENFDWKLKWVLGSSDLATLRESLLQIDLQCTKKNEGKTYPNTINFEANLDQVDNLIKELVKVKKELE